MQKNQGNTRFYLTKSKGCGTIRFHGARKYNDVLHRLIHCIRQYAAAKRGGLKVNLHKFIGEKLRELRLKRQLSLEKVGRVVGVTRMSMSRYERGTSTVSLDQLIQFSIFFDVDISMFFPPSVHTTEIDRKRREGTDGYVTAKNSRQNLRE
jgi:DNA-binding XRE family transcriptional regulator